MQSYLSITLCALAPYRSKLTQVKLAVLLFVAPDRKSFGVFYFIH